MNDPEMAREVESKRVVDPQGRSTGRLLECVGLESEGEAVWADRYGSLFALFFSAYHTKLYDDDRWIAPPKKEMSFTN